MHFTTAVKCILALIVIAALCGAVIMMPVFIIKDMVGSDKRPEPTIYVNGSPANKIVIEDRAQAKQWTAVHYGHAVIVIPGTERPLTQPQTVEKP